MATPVKTAPPPRRPTAAQTLAAANAGQNAAVAAGTPTVVATGVQAKMIAEGVTEVIDALRQFARGRQATVIPALQTTLQESFTHRSPTEISKLLGREHAREREFLRRQATRIQRDLPKALAEADVQKRSDLVGKLMEREQRYMAQREKAMTARAHSVIESLDLEEASPEGAYWMLGGPVHQHTPGCLAMSGKFWPWQVLREVIHPPVHPGCPCALIGLSEAVTRGYMHPDQLPDVKDALVRARANLALEETLYDLVPDDEEVMELTAEFLEEAQKRYPKGDVHGGEFMPKVGQFHKAHGLLHKILPGGPHHTQRGAGRHVWIKGHHTFVPADRQFERKVGGATFHSPPQSTNVYRDGKLVSEPGKPPTHPDVMPPKGSTPPAKLGTHGDLPAAGQAKAAKSREQLEAQIEQRLQNPKAAPLIDGGEDAKVAHDALIAQGFVVRKSLSKATKDGLVVEYISKQGHQITLESSKKSGRVIGVRWRPDFTGGLMPNEWSAFKAGNEPKGFSSQSAVVPAKSSQGPAPSFGGGGGGGGHTGGFQSHYAPKPPPKPITHAATASEPLEAGEIPNYDHVELQVKGDAHAGGSTGAKIGTAPDGSKYLLKTYGGDEDRIATELVANAIYRALGAKAADAGVKHLDNGKVALAYPLLEGETRKITEPSSDIGEHFMADALLANWDFIGLTDDNVLWGPDGKPFRVDQGGTLAFRAQGSVKPFGPVPAEVWSMLSPKGQGFGKVQVTPIQKRQQAAAIAKTLTPEKIDALMAEAPFEDAKMRDEVGAALKDRVAWMGRYAKGKEHESEALTGHAAAAELADGQDKLRLFPEQENALNLYAADDSVNDHLLSGKRDDATDEQRFITKELDSLLKHMRTSEDVTAFGGFDSDAVVGGHAEDLVGKTLNTKGFLNLDLNDREARKAQGVLQVLLPKGARALYTRGIPDVRVSREQSDLIAERDSRLRIVGVTKRNGKTYIEAVMLP